VRIEAIQKKYNVEVQFIHFPLHPETPEAGRTLEELFGVGSDDIASRYNHMKSLMDAEGLPYGPRTHTYNSRLAQELAAWAVTQPGGEKIHLELFRAYFVDSLNVGDKEVLLSVIEKCGLDKPQAEKVITEREYKSAVDADWQKSRQYGVTGVPTYVAAGNGMVGAQSYEAIEALLQEAKVELRG